MVGAVRTYRETVRKPFSDPRCNGWSTPVLERRGFFCIEDALEGAYTASGGAHSSCDCNGITPSGITPGPVSADALEVLVDGHVQTGLSDGMNWSAQRMAADRERR